MSTMQISVYSHFFKVQNYDRRTWQVVVEFAKKFVQMGLKREFGRFFQVPLRTYAAATVNRSEYRFHINAFESFLSLLKERGIRETEYDVIKVPLKAIQKIKHSMKDGWVPTELQVPIVSYLTCIEPTEDPNELVQFGDLKIFVRRAKFVGLQTGKGKSFVTMKAAMDTGSRVAMVIGAKYIEKWKIDIIKTFNIKKEDIVTITGTPKLKKILHEAKRGRLKAKFILISNATLRGWINNYEEGEVFAKTNKRSSKYEKNEYPCLPEDFMQTLGCHCRVIDEVHEDFHFNFKLDMYTHCDWSISLSATLLHREELVRKMYEVAYPKKERYELEEYDCYIKTYALLYEFSKPQYIRHKNGQGQYSHVMFEESLSRLPHAMKNYFDMIDDDMQINFFTDEYKKGDKALIFCSSVEMCRIGAKEFQKRYPHLDVKSYSSGEDDPYDYLMTSDIRFSTPQSAGTGVDIPGLMYTCQTIAVSSIQRNLQSFGRLRKPKDNRLPRFTYLVSGSIPKHVEYHKEKMEIFQARTASFRVNYHHKLI